MTSLVSSQLGKRPARILLTGFEPFGKWRVNSSWEGARIAARRRPGAIVLARLPVDHVAAADRLREILAKTDPTVCLMTGLAAGHRIRLEQVARRGPYVDQSEEEGAPDLDRSGDSLRGEWRWGAARARIRAASGPCVLSEEAGRYVCESAYRALLDWRAGGRGPRRAAFLHVPPISRVWPAERIADAIEAALAPYL